jgi:preprotein translocase subunit SecD
LNVYGLTDLNIRKASDLSGNRFMIVEIAGTSPSDLENLVAQQGKFEAKIGNETIFNGGNKDVTYVGRSGQDAGIYDCFAIQDGEACNFRFTIYLSEEAAKRQADATSNLSMNISSGGKYLSKPLDLYLDKNLLDSLNIGADLKGKIATQIQISGSGSGKTRQEAIDATKANMKKLQTILITGSLPFKLEIVKTDRISPVLGDKFTKTIFIASLLAVLSVFLIVLLRYRRIKISAAIVFMMLSEILITLGIAALIRWNIDLASIAGIIAAIGTGVNDQIVIVDESRRNKQDSLKQRIKNALFIIFTAYATAVVSLLPLYWAGAGLLKGFAFTSLLGITAGVFITRPAFADIARQLEEKEE